MGKYKKHNLAIWSHCSPTTYLCTLTPLLNLLSFSLSHTTSLREPSQQREVSMYGFRRFLHTNKSKQSFLFGRIPSSQTGESVLPAYLIFLSYVPTVQHSHSKNLAYLLLDTKANKSSRSYVQSTIHIPTISYIDSHRYKLLLSTKHKHSLPRVRSSLNTFLLR